MNMALNMLFSPLVLQLLHVVLRLVQVCLLHAFLWYQVRECVRRLAAVFCFAWRRDWDDLSKLVKRALQTTLLLTANSLLFLTSYQQLFSHIFTVRLPSWFTNFPPSDLLTLIFYIRSSKYSFHFPNRLSTFPSLYLIMETSCILSSLRSAVFLPP